MTPNNSNMINNYDGGFMLQSEGMSPLEASGRGGVGNVVEGNKNLKKGPWTAAEDQILMDYVRKHGEGNWNSVQRNSGLNRCGKSCRLRWANHLRPHLKKGTFSPEEERLILELHAKYGNKWARMASQLPGRTDNEIKNYWNTRVKRRQRQGLPLYPHDIRQNQQSQSQPLSLSHSQPTTLPCPTELTPATTTAIQNPFLSTTDGTTPTFFFQTQSPTQPYHLSPTQPCVSPHSSPHHPKPTTTFTSLPPFDPTTISTTSSFSSSPHSFTSHRSAPILGTPLRYKRYRDSAGFSPPISPTSQLCASMIRTSSVPDLTSFHLTDTSSMPDLTSFHLTSTNSVHDLASFQLGGTSSMSDISSFQFPRSFNPSIPPLPRTQFEYSDSLLSHTGSIYSVKSELPSNQMFQAQPEFTIDAKVSSAAEETQGSCGLLDELLQEAEALACVGGNNARSENGALGSFEEKNVLDVNYGSWLRSTSSMESSLLAHAEAKPVMQNDQVNAMPEDSSKQFSFNPSTDNPASNWYTDSGEIINNGQSSGVADASLDFDMQHMASFFPVGARA